jgi:nucleoside-diphosphate-sugar epimerase
VRVLVTGATGFVGSHTARALVRAGHDVRVLARDPAKVPAVFGNGPRLDVVTGDMTDALAVRRALEGCDAVVHAAALVALRAKDAARVLVANRLGVERVVGGAVEAGIARVVYVSSAVALFRSGGAAQGPITGASPVGDGASAYARSKADCERYVRALQERGASIRTTYPGGVFGPDDPALSESNRGLLALFRDAAVVTDGGLQVVDVRDVAAAHARLVDAPPGAGRHMLGGHFVRWSELVDAFEAITGRRFRRVPVPGAILRAAGAAADVVKRVWDFDLPLTREAAQIMTSWPPPGAPDDELRALGVTFRPLHETLGDTLAWMHTTGILAADRVGALARSRAATSSPA